MKLEARYKGRREDMRYPLRVRNSLKPVDECSSDLELHGKSTCGRCSKVIPQSDALVSVYYVGQTQEQEHFCGQHCKEQWHIKRLNQLGM